jgi:hypothetical protein
MRPKCRATSLRQNENYVNPVLILHLKTPRVWKSHYSFGVIQMAHSAVVSDQALVAQAAVNARLSELLH